MASTVHSVQGEELDLLMDYLERLRKGEHVQPEEYLQQCPEEKRADLRLAMEGAAALESLVRALRPFIGPEAQERTLEKLRRELAAK